MAGHFPILTDPLIVPLHIVTGFTHNTNNWTFQPHHADRSPVLVSHRGPVFCILTFYRPAHGMGFQPGFNIRFPGGLILWFTSSGKPGVLLVSVTPMESPTSYSFGYCPSYFDIVHH